MSATIKDIARETGLALATISKYINGGTVRPQNKKQIDEAIRKLNYVPRNTARGLRSSKTYRIGLLACSACTCTTLGLAPAATSVSEPSSTALSFRWKSWATA